MANDKKSFCIKGRDKNLPSKINKNNMKESNVKKKTNKRARERKIKRLK